MDKNREELLYLRAITFVVAFMMIFWIIGIFQKFELPWSSESQLVCTIQDGKKECRCE